MRSMLISKSTSPRKLPFITRLGSRLSVAVRVAAWVIGCLWNGKGVHVFRIIIPLFQNKMPMLLYLLGVCTIEVEYVFLVHGLYPAIHYRTLFIRTRIFLFLQVLLPHAQDFSETIWKANIRNVQEKSVRSGATWLPKSVSNFLESEKCPVANPAKVLYRVHSFFESCE